MRSRSTSSLSSSLASWSVWLIRKKAAMNETIAVVLKVSFFFSFRVFVVMMIGVYLRKSG